MDLNPKFATEGTFTPDNLVAGDYPMVTEQVTIKSGQNLKRGAVLGRVTSSGEYRLSATPAAVGEEGSETPRRILLHDTDASGGAKAAPVAVTGEFNARALTFGTGHSATTTATKDALEDVGIFIRSSVKA